MKTIYLLRHAKSTGKDTDMADFDRPLAERGVRDAEKVAAALAARDIRPSVIVTSPAVRAMQTAKIFAGGLGYRIKSIKTRKALYDEEADQFIQVLHGLSPNLGSAMLVGHNPSLSEFASVLCAGFDRDLPTCAVVGFEFEANTWKTLEPGTGVLATYDAPARRAPKKAKKTDGKTRRKDLQKKIEQKIGEILEDHDRVAMKKVRKPIKKSSRKIARKFMEKLEDK
jgi:phosphohistidine phosphatase